MLIHRDEIKELQKLKNKDNEKVIDEIVNYFNNYAGVSCNTENLVYLPKELSEKYKYLVSSNFEDVNENLSSNEIQKLVYLIDNHLVELKDCIDLFFKRKWNYEELKNEYDLFFKLRKKLLKVS
jgi:GTP cyclohydrolase I